MADKRATLTLRFGDQEVRYEAEREAVEAQLEQVLGRLLRDAPADVQVGLTDVTGAEAGHEHCARLVESLVEPVSVAAGVRDEQAEPAAGEPEQAARAEDSAGETGIPRK